MRKKVVSLILAVAMLAVTVCTAFAADVNVDVSGTNIAQLVQFFSDNTPNTLQKRLEILEYIRMYMGGTDRDMETLINAVASKDFSKLDSDSSDLQNIFNKLMEDDVYPAALFGLEMLRAIPASTRKTVINGFGVKKDDQRVSYTIQDTDKEAEISAALLALYNDDNVYPAKLRDAMEEHVAFDVTVAPYVVLNLFTAWKDTIQFTDDAAGTGFAAYQVNSSYGKRLMNYMDGYTLGGRSISDVMDIADALADVLNSSYTAQEIEYMKTVLDDSGLDIYVPATSIINVEEITVNGKSIDLSTDDNQPTKVEVKVSDFTVIGYADSNRVTVEYASVVSGQSPSSWKWYSDMDSENIKLGEKKRVAVRFTSEDGETSEIYYIQISRPDTSSSSSNNSNKSSSGITTDTSEPVVTPPPEQDALFADTENHWSKNYVTAMVNRGIFVGYEDGTFKPDRGVTRQEMAVVLVRLLNLESELGTVTTTNYTDHDAIAVWARDAVALLGEKGIYLGYDDGEFKPERVLTREEIVALAMRMYGYTDADPTAPYSDAEKIGDWARKYVGQATNLGIIDGRDDGLFAPAANVTRAEAAKILYNYMNVKGIF